MIVPGDKRVVSRMAVGKINGSHYYGVAGGPVGATTMTFAVIVTARRSLAGGGQTFFSGTNLSTGTGGWLLGVGAGALNIMAVSGAGIVTNNQAIAGTWPRVTDIGRTFVIVGCLVGGSLSSSVFGEVAVAPTAVVGYIAKPAGQRTAIGTNDALGTGITQLCTVSDCAMLQGYDGTGFISATFGNGLAGLAAMWAEDVQQGRAMKWPRVAAVSSDW